jgi:hypothetical protein
VKTNYVSILHGKISEVFESQNVENSHFDVTFVVDERELYAHKFILVSVSDPFNAMLSDRWARSKDKSIKIENHSFEEFYQFLC